MCLAVENFFTGQAPDDCRQRHAGVHRAHVCEVLIQANEVAVTPEAISPASTTVTCATLPAR